MKTIVHKAYVDFEKEEKWLNQMAQKGLNFSKYSFLTYTFEKGTPGEYIYRIELLKELPMHRESKEYIRFMEENGVDCVTTWFRWAFFRKKASEGAFDIYSDIESRISHYKRVIALMGTVGASNLVIAFTNYARSMSSGYKHDFYLNFNPGLLNLTLGMALTAFAFLYARRIYRLRKENQLYE